MVASAVPASLHGCRLQSLGWTRRQGRGRGEGVCFQDMIATSGQMVGVKDHSLKCPSPSERRLERDAAPPEQFETSRVMIPWRSVHISTCWI